RASLERIILRCCWSADTDYAEGARLQGRRLAGGFRLLRCQMMHACLQCGLSGIRGEHEYEPVSQAYSSHPVFDGSLAAECGGRAEFKGSLYSRLVPDV